MTKDEAKWELEDKDKELETTYCPLARGICLHNCVCYHKSFIFQGNINDENSYNIRGGFCDNAMFSGKEM